MSPVTLAAPVLLWYAVLNQMRPATANQGACNMLLVSRISVSELHAMSEKMSEPLVKGVVDINQRLLVVDAEMHVDQEQLLLESGSIQADLWGINLWPGQFGTDDFVEFDSMSNIRPWQNNRSRSVMDHDLRERIKDVVAEKVYE